MSGGSKKTTVAYWYRILLHLGVCKGPVDALLEIRGGNRVAWQGELAASGQLDIDEPNLWGGKKKEGGMDGAMDVLFGDAAQGTNDYLTAEQGPDQPTYRGKLTAVWRGGRFGTNPYPKDLAFKVRRILQGWDGAAWYPETAEITMASGGLNMEIGPLSDGWSYKIVANGSPDDYSAENYDHSAWATGASPFASATGHPYAPAGGWPDAVGTTWPLVSTLWVRRVFSLASVADLTMTIFVDNWATVWVNGVLVLPRVGENPNPSVEAFEHAFTVPASILHVGDNVIALKAEDEGTYSYAAFRVDSAPSDFVAMNPAHIVYDSLTAADMLGEPVALINDASFRAAADVLAAEGIGLCLRSDEYPSVEDMQRQILDIIGGSLTQSRVDGLYYLDLLRPPADIGALPVITADDVYEFRQQPAPGTQELINQVLVTWRDPGRNEERTTAPLQSLGAIQAAGGVISETRSYPEIPTEQLALRIGARDLQAKGTPLSRFDLVTNRRPWAIRKGTHFRLQLPAEGIADMVCVLADMRDAGLTDGRLRIKAVQDVFTMPATAYVVAEPGQAQPPATIPTSPPYQLLVETPYVELAARLSPSELAAFPEDSSAFLAIATRPAVGLNYTLYSAGSGETLEDYATGDWCPTALIVEAANYLDTAFTLASGELLDRVELGSWALWDTEIVRVVALDAGAGTITLARGCIDTLPEQHAAGSRIYFAGDWYATDGREYTAFEAVTAKLPVASGSAEQALADATLLSLGLGDRPAKPYPPANVRFNDSYFPASIGGADLLTIDWAHRDRILQADQIIDWTQADIGPEPGVTYTIWLYDETDTLRRTETGLTGTTYTWATEAEDCLLLSNSAGDPDWDSVVAALHMDGTDGDIAIVDETGRAWSRSGTGAFLSTEQQKFGTTALKNTNINSDFYVPSGILTDSDLFTAEGWFYLLGEQFKGSSGSVVTPLVTQSVNSPSGEFGFFVRWDTKVVHFVFRAGVAGDGAVDGVTVIATNTWYHFAATWDGTTHRGFINGNQEYAVAKPFGWKNTGQPLRLARNTAYNNTWWSALNGFLDDVRITKGVARYTAPFTPPAAPFPGPVYRLNDSVRAEIASVRGAYGSLHFSHAVNRVPPPSGA